MMGSVPEMKEPFSAILEEKWKELYKYYNKNPQNVMIPITVTRDTALHMAVYGQTSYPLQEIHELARKNNVDPLLSMKNVYGDTVLHEAVMTRNYGAVEFIVQQCQQLVQATNEFGMTPLYIAASFGNTKCVRTLAKKPGQIIDGSLSPVHVRRNDSTTIFHVAISGKHFGTALTLLKLDKSLGNLKDSEGRTALHLLADMPSAFRSGYPMNLFELLLYSCLPVEGEEDANQEEKNERENEEKNGGKSADHHEKAGKYEEKMIKVLKGCQLKLSWIYIQIFKILSTGFVERMQKEKHSHVFASKIAKILVQDHFEWDQQIELHNGNKVRVQRRDTSKDDDIVKMEQSESSEGRRQNLDECCITNKKGGKKFEEQNPLFIATSGGITEIVDEILKVHPQAIEHLNNTGQNLLHVAVLHRKKDIFDSLEGKKILRKRMSRRIDNNGRTLLHHVADMQHYTPGTLAGPAFKLQEELIWLERVRKLCPNYYFTKQDEAKKKTAKEFFQETHKEMLEDARKWIKETSQSCSAVAVLVSTVVYAAAYTVPGGSNEHGIPIFVQSPYFVFFTIMDVVSLAASLTSVMMFLSILTNSCELEDFRHSLPWKLNLGFTFLFFSIITTMLSFGATILLIIRGRKRWTTSLISVAAFLPVSVFALMQQRLYFAFWENLKELFKLIIRYSVINYFLQRFRSRRKPDVTEPEIEIFSKPDVTEREIEILST